MDGGTSQRIGLQVEPQNSVKLIEKNALCTTQKLGITFLLSCFLVYLSSVKEKLLIENNPLRVE